MASATVIERAEPRRRWRLWPGSRLGRLILVLNLLGLAILIAGALILNELGRGLIQARIDSLTTEGSFIANVIVGGATSPEPALSPERARRVMQLLYIPRSQRARLFDANGRLLADSYFDADRVEWKPLPPARKPGRIQFRWLLQDKDATDSAAVQAARASLLREIGQARRGAVVAGLRRAQNGQRVVSISIPVQRVQEVLGVLTLETGDVDEIIAAQRRALAPFILVAIAVTLLSSFLLTRLVAWPVLQLARSADSVRLSSARAISLPDLARRNDELGDLTRALQAMTLALSDRMEAIERFAADVAHEIRNPLTSIRSAVETLDLVGDKTTRDRLLAILKQDVGRLDRLITDISNASRLDAELAREQPRALDLDHLLGELASLHRDRESRGAPEAKVVYSGPTSNEPVLVLGREGPLSQVFRNLIENARSFSPPGGAVAMALQTHAGQATVTIDDDGPGIPPENLETVFERFYTARPKGAAFGGHSGLGLSIARQIVEAHGGRIWAENRTDASGKVQGARFTLSLPMTRS